MFTTRIYTIRDERERERELSDLCAYLSVLHFGE